MHIGKVPSWESVRKISSSALFRQDGPFKVLFMSWCSPASFTGTLGIEHRLPGFEASASAC